jgi:hypothetical protein
MPKHPGYASNSEDTTGQEIQPDDYSAYQSELLLLTAPIRYCVDSHLYLTEAQGYCFPHRVGEQIDVTGRFVGPSNESHARKYRLDFARTSFEDRYSNSRNNIIGAVLRKPLKFFLGGREISKENLPEKWKYFIEDVDTLGTSLKSYMKKVFRDALDGSFAGIFTDTHSVDVPLTTQERESSIGLRPWFVSLKHEDIYEVRGAASVEFEAGGVPSYRTRAKYLRFRCSSSQDEERIQVKEFKYENDKNFLLPQELDQYQAGGQPQYVGTTYYSIYEKQENGKFEAVIEGQTLRSIGGIPFEPVYGGSKFGYCKARPVFLGVAKLNLAHWKISASIDFRIDQSGAFKEHYFGVQSEDEVRFASDNSILLENANAKYTITSQTLDDINEAMSRKKDLEASITYLSYLILSSGQGYGGEDSRLLVEGGQRDSVLVELANELETAINNSLNHAAVYMGIEDSEEVLSIKIDEDLSIAGVHSQQLLALSTMTERGQLTVESLLRVAQAGEVFTGVPSFDAEKEAEKLADQRAAGLINQGTTGRRRPRTRIDDGRSRNDGLEGEESPEEAVETRERG